MDFAAFTELINSEEFKELLDEARKKQILRLRGILDSLGWESGQVPEALREACGFRIVEDPASEFILK